MKKGIDAAIPEFRQRRTAQLAESELRHLELILASYAGPPDVAPGRFPTGYWDKRIAQLDADYDLVPSQCHRVASLQRKLALLDNALDSAYPESHEDAQNRRAAA
ncbi:hypothetical protein P9250_05590 [Caballeronia sp. LP006]|jgi:hypothetical protein|uniref:hypothetical protein n=1 Tax=unclassified Caballeronia TaxID=2646786 RepID=UPI001FD33C51|nr:MULTISPECIES: hypothetical protein [unclassified Caballeronia]MDR5773773.1 hypothetical protein [Caballeronia sp. LZ002]MDR5799448.1 hypothetical protein [Caballeronia sp. LZ001]MDR5827337.1 hypothetical protein [Caballeronia sp. LP006]MDR5849208.1 hypothetical protein [Caballeronia sp. LZ003]